MMKFRNRGSDTGYIKMSENKIQAIVAETNDGAYCQVLLQAIPRVGDYIRFYSHLDQSNEEDPTHNYEITDVVHEISDVTDKVEKSKSGHHSIKINVCHQKNSVFK